MRELLLNLADHDRRLTAELGEAHPKVQELREANARELELVVDEDGWPIPAEAGDEGSLAALHIALHASVRPAFQRRCLTMMMAAAARGEVPEEQVEALRARLLP